MNNLLETWIVVLSRNGAHKEKLKDILIWPQYKIARASYQLLKASIPLANCRHEQHGDEFNDALGGQGQGGGNCGFTSEGTR